MVINLIEVRYTKNVVENPGPTLAIEYQTKNLILQNGSIVKAQIWDTCKIINIELMLI